MAFRLTWLHGWVGASSQDHTESECLCGNLIIIDRTSALIAYSKANRYRRSTHYLPFRGTNMRGGDRGGACPIADVTNEKKWEVEGERGGAVADR